MDPTPQALSEEEAQRLAAQVQRARAGLNDAAREINRQRNSDRGHPSLAAVDRLQEAAFELLTRLETVEQAGWPDKLWRQLRP